MPPRSRIAFTLLAGVTLASCRTGQPPSGTGSGVAARPAEATAAAASGPGDSTRARRRPDPRMLDSARRNIVAQVMQQIAGREQQPAGQVFKNVKVLTDVPAAQLLTMMNEQYGRGLGVGCNNCHVPGKWDSDEKKNKTIAREMQRLANRLNGTDLPAIPDLEKEFDKINCVTCHRGSTHPANSMPIPPPTTAPVSGR